MTFDRRTQTRDFQWFGRHPDRTIFARLASELEEIGARNLAGIDAERHEISTIIIVRRAADRRRERVALFMPTFYGRPLRLPADEVVCTRIFEEAE